MRILYTATNSGVIQIGSRAIRAFEGGLASHCGAVLSNGDVVDASWPKGVQSHRLEDFLTERTLIAEFNVPLPDEVSAENFLIRAAAEGWKYDLLDIASFLVWRDIGRRDRYVCSSLMLRAKMAGGIQVFERHDRWGVRHDLIHSSTIGKLVS